MFVIAGSVQNFARAAKKVGLEIVAESDIEDAEDFPEGFTSAGGTDTLPRRLYLTMPTLEAFRQILSLWNAHQRGDPSPAGAAPWWSAFDLLLELRPWGPKDRLPLSARQVIEERLPSDDDQQVSVELEIWPTASVESRVTWRQEVKLRVIDLGGRVLDGSSITGAEFNYEAVLVGLPAAAVREMLASPDELNGLATLDGIQFILPQTIGQTEPPDSVETTTPHEPTGGFAADAPIRAALLDGTPTAGHTGLNGGVVVEDVHDLVPLSAVDQRYHATAMASLILRGDLAADGQPLRDTRLVSVPLLVDTEHGARSPSDKLFVDLLYVALERLTGGEDPLAQEIFVVNLAIGVPDLRFAGWMSSLARLIDWWSAKEGVLFVISAGNIRDGLQIPGMTALEFEDTDDVERRERVRKSMRDAIHSRTLLSPAEALNGLAVGALSRDLHDSNPPRQAGVMNLESEHESLPQMTSALGLGLHGSIKPDLLGIGGRLEVRAHPGGDDAILRVVDSQRTGLVVAAPTGGPSSTRRVRGTSPAAALTTRAVLQAAQALTEEGGPYSGQELPREDFALLGRALAVNSARWPEDASGLYHEELARLGRRRHHAAKAETCRYFGYGVITPELMQRSPERGVTLVGLGSLKKDEAQIFRMPLPASMSGERVPRSMRVTLAWFSPTNIARAQYRLAGLESVALDEEADAVDKSWGLDMTPDGPDSRTVKRGSAWSRRLVNRVQAVPRIDEDEDLTICVQCRDTASGGLNQDQEIRFAVVATLEIETEVQYDIYEEIEQAVRVRLRGGE